MRSSHLHLAVVVLLLCCGFGAHSQKGKREVVKHDQEIRDMITFLQYMLNTLGDANTSNRDKDVLVTESYVKVFRDAKVQIEDDLDENRTVITNKDVPAYLKDVDFFFTNVRFEFIIEDVQTVATSSDKISYKVSLKRNLTGTTVDGKTVNKTIPRYVEVNYNTKDQDLKIVSIYTNPFNEKQALLAWWNELSFEWRNIFSSKLGLQDSVSISEIKKITTLDELDLNGNEYIQSIEPLGQLLNLRVLNLANTNIADLSPIRNLTDLVELDLSHTRINDLSALRYASSLKKLNIAHTQVDSINVLDRLINLINLEMPYAPVKDYKPLSNLTELQYLNLEATTISDLSPIDSLLQITELNLSKTPIHSIYPLYTLKNMAVLNIDSTNVNDLLPVSYLKNLQVLNINYTPVTELEALHELGALEKVYCDNTGINQSTANNFMALHPKVLVVFNSKDLLNWWSSLAPVWRDVLSRSAKIKTDPGKEDLAKVTNLDSINIANYISIRDLKPLERLTKLKVILANQTGITDLLALQNIKEVRYLDISNTAVSDVAPISKYSKLKVLKADNTKVDNIDTLSQLDNLQTLYIDGTNIKDADVQRVLQKNPRCLVVYKTPALETWWNELSDDWKQVFQIQTRIDEKNRRESLHRLTQLEKITFKDIQVNDLSVLRPFIRLKDLHFSETAITDLSPLADLNTLTTLQMSDNAIRNLGPLQPLKELQHLDISNTPVEDMEAVRNLKSLISLNCAGTQVKKLNDLEHLGSLEFFDCSNTDVKSLDPIADLSIKTLKCYNTKISKSQIEKFKKKNPDCNITYYR